jgi:copper homeostasis protein
VFHRAIDHCRDLDKSMEELIRLGIPRVLSSGGEASLVQGLQNLKRLQQRYGQQITIIAGGGLRASNFQQALLSGCVEFHSSALIDNSVMADAAEIKRMKKYV